MYNEQVLEYDSSQDVCLPTTGTDYLFAVNLYINVILEFKFQNFVYSNR